MQVSDESVHYTDRDIVYDPLHPRKVAMVTSSFYDSSSDEDSSSEEDEPKLERGQVKIMWYPDKKEQIVEESNLRLADRSIVPGDAVRRLGSNAKGFVTSINLFCDCIVNGNPYRKLRNINSRNFISPDRNLEGFLCVYNNWLGEIDSRKEVLKIQLRNGSIYYFKSTSSKRGVSDVYHRKPFDGTPFFYRGQHVVIQSEGLENAVLASGPGIYIDSSMFYYGLVLDVRVDSLTISWYMQCYHNSPSENLHQQRPPSKIYQNQLKNVKVINEFANISVPLGYRVLYSLTEDDARLLNSNRHAHKHDVTKSKIHSCLQQLRRRPNHPDLVSRKSLRHQRLYVERLLERRRINATSALIKNTVFQTVLKVVKEILLANNISIFASGSKHRGDDDILHHIASVIFFTLNNARQPLAETLPLYRDSFLTGNKEDSDTVILFDHLLSAFTDSQRTETLQIHSALELIKVVDYFISSFALADTGSSLGETPTMSTPDILSTNNSSDSFVYTSTSSPASADSSLCTSSTTEKKRNKKILFNRRLYNFPLAAGNEVCLEVVRTRTVADVLWRDGTTERLESIHLGHLVNIGDKDFFPYDFVVDIRANSDEKPERFGIVRKGNQVERTCDVTWFTDSANDRGRNLGTEIVSMYDIADKEEWMFNILDMVARISHTPELCDGCENAGLGSAGAVVSVDCDRGFLRVWWAEGFEGCVPPYDVIRTNDDTDEPDSFFSDDSSDSEYSDDSSISTRNHGAGDRTTTASDDDSWATASVGESSDSGEDSTTDEFDSFSSNFEKIDQGKDSQSKSTTSHGPLRDGVLFDGNFKKSSDNDTFVVEHSSVNSSNEVCFLASKFPGFSILEENDCLEHHDYADVPMYVHKDFQQACRKELKLLTKNLPDGVFVRGFDNRMDLYSAMIIGPVGTPYEDGLFFFDIHLSSSYPALAPDVFYYSYCSGRLNPNLYEDGKVCVSLLGTWLGKGTEVWGSDSTLLQVFVSLQGLILNKSPYFNEAGFDKQRNTVTGCENAKMYNEMVIIKLIQSCSKMIQNPRTNFVQEIKEHFNERGFKIIDRMEAWMENDVECDFPLLPLSAGCKSSLRREIAKFREHLSNI